MFESNLNKGKANGYTPLDNSKLVPAEFIPSSGISRILKICEENLSGVGTIEEQLIEYFDSIEFTKDNYDGEYMIIIDTCGSGSNGGGIGLNLLV